MPLSYLSWSFFSLCSTYNLPILYKLTGEVGWSKIDDSKRSEGLFQHIFCAPLFFSLKTYHFWQIHQHLVISNVISYWARSMGPQFYVLNSIIFPVYVATPISWLDSDTLPPFHPSPFSLSQKSEGLFQHIFCAPLFFP